MFFLFRRKTKASLLSPILLLIIIYFLYEGYFFKREIEFPYLNFKRNIVSVYEITSKDIKDTVSVLQRSVSYFRKLNAGLVKEFERNDSIWSVCFYFGNYYYEEQANLPFFAGFDRSSQVYSIRKLKTPLEINSSWQDENTGLEHVCVSIDSVLFGEVKIEAVKIETTLSKTSKKMIYQHLDSLKLSSEGKLELLKAVNGKWSEWFAKDLGLILEVLPNGETKVLLEQRKIYWFERVSRFFDFGIR